MDMVTIANPLIQNLIAFGSGALILLIYNYFKFGSILKQGGEKTGNFLALLVYKYGLKNMKNQELKEKTTRDLDLSADGFNSGWDKGLRGIVVK